MLFQFEGIVIVGIITVVVVSIIMFIIGMYVTQWYAKKKNGMVLSLQHLKSI